jgi:hypothetical protein
MQDVWDALEATTPNRSRATVDPPANASRRDVTLYRDTLLRFLSELDAELSVGEIREALEEYTG